MTKGETLRILVLSASIPFPPIGGGKLRTYHLMLALAQRHDVTLVGFSYGEQPQAPPLPVQVVAVPWTNPALYQQMHGEEAAAAQSATEWLSRDGDEPWCVSWANTGAMEAAIEHLAGAPFDLVLIEGTPMARYLHLLPDHVPRVLDFFDVFSRMQLSGADSKAAAFEAERTKRFETAAAKQCDLCLTVSEVEAAAARDLLGIDHVCVIPNGVDTRCFTPDDSVREPASLLFAGTLSYRPNSEAVLHFVRNVFPLIRDELPAAVFHVVGVDPPGDVIALAGAGVVVHGFVPDLRPFYRRAAVVVVPLLRGGGTKIKVLEAAACGKAIVTTSVGADGLPFGRNEDLIVADSDADFARGVVTLARDAGLRRKLGANARRVSLAFDWEAIGARTCEVVESVCEARASAC